MNLLLPYLISWLQEYGYPALWVSVFVASAGIPLPIGLILLAAGAFASFGDFNIVLLAITAISASVCGDSLGYFIGRRWGTKVLDWLEYTRARQFITPQTVTRSRVYFRRHGGWAIFLSRFLVSALGGITNLLAGADPYPFRRFLCYDAAGETIGTVSSLVLGYVVGASWEAMGDLLGGLSGLVLGILLVVYLVVRVTVIVRATRIVRVTRKAELAANKKLSRITTEESRSSLGD